MKGYSQEIKDAIVAGWPQTDLLEFSLSSGPVYLTTAGHDITYEGITYLSSALVLGVSDIKQQQELRVNQLDLQLTAVDQSLLALFLNQNQQNRKVFINRVVLTPVHVPIGTLLFTQYIIDALTVDDTEESSVINLSMSNFMSDFQSVRGIRTTLSSFRRFYPNSTAFINSKDTGKELKWGGK